jgi:hypothetical protein
MHDLWSLGSVVLSTLHKYALTYLKQMENRINRLCGTLYIGIKILERPAFSISRYMMKMEVANLFETSVLI